MSSLLGFSNVMNKPLSLGSFGSGASTVWEHALSRCLVVAPCVCQFCWAALATENIAGDKDALFAGLLCLVALPGLLRVRGMEAVANLLATVRLLVFGYLAYAAYDASSMAGFKRTPPIVSYYALQAVSSLLFFSKSFQCDLAVSIDDTTEDIRDMLPSQVSGLIDCRVVHYNC